MSEFRDAVFAAESASLLDVVRAIDAGSISAAFAVDARGRLEGMMTDGDVRRALLDGAATSDRARSYLSSTPFVVNVGESRSAVLDLMRSRRVSQIPIVDDAGRLVGVHTMQALVGGVSRPNCAVILAGGRGTRLHPLTADIPKPMVRVAGRPILERLVTHLVGYGISDIVLAVGHLAETITEYFGDGSALGCRISYISENPDSPLGTCGPLSLLEQHVGQLRHPVVVINGDLLTTVDIGALLRFHDEANVAMTIGTRAFPLHVPFAVLEQAGGLVTSIVEKPVFEHVISIGVYVLGVECLGYVPAGTTYDMPDLVNDLISGQRLVGAWQSDDDWIDIGSPADLWHARGGR